jgi:ribonuclease E
MVQDGLAGIHNRDISKETLMANTHSSIATDSAAELRKLVGDDATADFEADPKFVDSNPTETASSENVEVQREADDVEDSEEEDDDELDEEDEDEEDEDDDVEDDELDEEDDDEDEDDEDDDEDDIEEGVDEDDLDDDDMDTDEVADPALRRKILVRA